MCAVLISIIQKLNSSADTSTTTARFEATSMLVSFGLTDEVLEFLDGIDMVVDEKIYFMPEV
jgi:hypothetical protein